MCLCLRVCVVRKYIYKESYYVKSSWIWSQPYIFNISILIITN